MKERQKRLKRGSRHWRKLQQSIRRASRDSSRIRDNWEQHTARKIARQNNIVVVEDLKPNNMRRSARGTSLRWADRKLRALKDRLDAQPAPNVEIFLKEPTTKRYRERAASLVSRMARKSGMEKAA